MNAPDESPDAAAKPGRLRRAASAAVSKPRDAARAVGGGFKWAGSGVAGAAKGAGGAVSGRSKGARDAVTSRASSPWTAVKQRFQSNPWVGIAAISGAVLVVAWIAWAIYVGTEHGGNAALGVVISWPAVVMAVALLLAPFAGLYLLIRRLQGGESADPPIAGGAPGDDDPGAVAGDSTT